ncbi:class I SAM-dependent methyltransferase family protein [Candidatus Woesearchaeota archaeon CG_4_10_14_0_2_um_filter_33_13]|nr:MAG: class I SAM-dependent methyltransferase family protein [Candidatus Woesearchaeota archaeon CG_4_10_14_0_2_um_filter_33_13]
MLAAETELKNAEKVKNFLIQKGLLETNHLAVKELGLIYFPINKKSKVPGAKVVDTKFSFPKKKLVPKVENLLKDKLSNKEIRLIPRSQEIVGKIMILEVPEELKSKERVIAEAYLQINEHVETVVSKEQFHEGEYRLRKVKFLAGKKTKETIHYENGVKIRLDLEKTYFSARSGNERLRIARLVKPGEEVLVMFSGAAPYPLVIAKNSKAKVVYGVEMNPLSHQYALENVKLNNLDNRVAIFEGDVRTIVPKIKKTFDRIVMPLPKTGQQFLSLALKKIKIGGIIHYYSFLSEEEMEQEAKIVRDICKEEGNQIRIVKKVRCGQFSPRIFRICFDIKVLK